MLCPYSPSYFSNLIIISVELRAHAHLLQPAAAACPSRRLGLPAAAFTSWGRKRGRRKNIWLAQGKREQAHR
jgi:hypothetical protein